MISLVYLRKVYFIYDPHKPDSELPIAKFDGFQPRGVICLHIMYGNNTCRMETIN